MKLSVFRSASLLASGAYYISQVSALKCTAAAFQTLLTSHATVIQAVPVPANGTYGDNSEAAYPANSTALPALCALTINVTSSATSSYQFGLFLPNDWNGRFSAVGNGGAAGGINWPSMGIMVKYGFAVVSTDTGHRGGFGDVNFAINADGTWNTEQIADSAYRALHGSVVLGKQLTVGNYGRNISYSYYNGCSTGGRQGLTEVQRFPEDFDGVLAGSPAWETDVIGLWTVQMGMINLPNTSENHIPTTMYPVIQAEVMRQCDGIDGVEDGVIMDPQACHFRPETLLCAGQNASEGSCVTSPQIDTLHQLYGHYPTVEKPLFFHPLPLGSEPAWASSLPEDEPASVSWAAILSFQDPNWDWRTLNYSGIQEATTRFYTGGADMVPNQFDITPFAKRGGKLFHYHGQGDTTVPYESSRTWYENTYRNVTTKGVDVDNFYRLFFVPGMLHCLQSNGDAPWYFGAGEQPEILGSDAYGVPGFRDEQHDAVLALMKWVEEGAAPDHIVATKYVNDNVSLGFKRQRKICKYPGRAKFVGDEVDDADSWVC